MAIPSPKPPKQIREVAPSSPLVIDTRTLQSNEKSTEENHRDAEQHLINSWNISLTFVIAICAVLQFGGIVGQIVVYRGQSKIMASGLAATEKAANAAEIAAKTAYVTQLPKLVLLKSEVRGGNPYDAPINSLFWPTIAMAVINYGGTPAFVINWSLSIAYEQETAETIIDEPLGIVINPTEHKWLPSVRPKEYASLEKADQILRGEGRYTVIGQVLYEDLFGNRKVFDFCRQLGYWDDQSVFIECEKG